MEGLSDPGDVFAVDSADRNSSHFQHVNVFLFPESYDLILFDMSVGKHSLLLGNVGPILGWIQLLDLVVKGLSHLDDSLTHCEDVFVPLGFQLWISEDSFDDI